MPASVWTAAKKRCDAQGTPDAGAFDVRPASHPQWLDSEDLPWIAQILQIIICTCDAQRSDGWASYLPFKLLQPDASAPIKVVGLALSSTRDHWRSVQMSRMGPLPSPKACSLLWGPHRKELVASADHRRIHEEWRFSSEGDVLAERDGVCECMSGEEAVKCAPENVVE